VWAGAARPGTPMVDAMDRRRSMRLAALAPLAISIPSTANAVVAAVLGASALPTSASALATYAASTEVPEEGLARR